MRYKCNKNVPSVSFRGMPLHTDTQADDINADRSLKHQLSVDRARNVCALFFTPHSTYVLFVAHSNEIWSHTFTHLPFSSINIWIFVVAPLCNATFTWQNTAEHYTLFYSLSEHLGILSRNSNRFWAEKRSFFARKILHVSKIVWNKFGVFCSKCRQKETIWHGRFIGITMETTFDELIYESDGSSEKSEAKIMFKLNTVSNGFTLNVKGISFLFLKKEFFVFLLNFAEMSVSNIVKMVFCLKCYSHVVLEEALDCKVHKMRHR